MEPREVAVGKRDGGSTHTDKPVLSNQGFTVVELLVAIFMSLIVMASVYSTYHSQQKSYLLQEQVAAMQQNLRAGMFFIEREIRMAGCDPTEGAGAGFVTAGTSTIRFTEDVNANGTIDPDEDITYSLNGSNLERTVQGTQVIAEDIEALNFVYLDKDGNVITDDLTDPDNLKKIRSVELAMVARTGRGDPGFRDNESYKNLRGNEILPPQGDSNRRRLLTTQITCRNL